MCSVCHNSWTMEGNDMGPFEQGAADLMMLSLFSLWTLPLVCVQYFWIVVKCRLSDRKLFIERTKAWWSEDLTRFFGNEWSAVPCVSWDGQHNGTIYKWWWYGKRWFWTEKHKWVLFYLLSYRWPKRESTWKQTSAWKMTVSDGFELMIHSTFLTQWELEVCT